MENKTPGEKLKSWVENLPQNIQTELISLACYFHPDEAVHLCYPYEKQVVAFLNYSIDQALSKRELVARLFISMRLIDYAFSGRDSEQGWTETLDRNVMAAARMQSKGGSTTIVDSFLNSYDERKTYWIQLAQQWASFKVTDLSDNQISDWGFFDK